MCFPECGSVFFLSAKSCVNHYHGSRLTGGGLFLAIWHLRKHKQRTVICLLVVSAIPPSPPHTLYRASGIYQQFSAFLTIPQKHTFYATRKCLCDLETIDCFQRTSVLTGYLFQLRNVGCNVPFIFVFVLITTR